MKLNADELDKMLEAQGESAIPLTFKEVAGPNGQVIMAPVAALPPMRDLGREPENFSNREFFEQFGMEQGSSSSSAIRTTRRPGPHMAPRKPLMPVLKRGVTRDQILAFMGIKKEEEGSNVETGTEVSGAVVAAPGVALAAERGAHVLGSIRGDQAQRDTDDRGAAAPEHVPGSGAAGAGVPAPTLGHDSSSVAQPVDLAPAPVARDPGASPADVTVVGHPGPGGEGDAAAPDRPAAEPLLVSGEGGPRFQYLGGPAGTGKTFAIKLAAEADPGLILCATTGIAACNLGESVTTINSLLCYFDLESLKESWTRGMLERRLGALAGAGCKRIVLDEVSMMDGRQLAVILEALELVNEALERDNRKPIKLTLTGDFLQLPPVEAVPLKRDRDGRMKGGGCFAFEIPQWAKFESTMLMNIRRQADPRFIGALREARRGNGRATAEILHAQCQDFDDKDFNGTTLLARNNAVDQFNMTRLLKLPGPDIYFKPDLWGKPRTEWKNIPGGDKKLPNEQLNLRKGALVMILANLSKRSMGFEEDGFEYVNGDLGIFEDVVYDKTPEKNRVEGYAVVKLHRTGKTVTVSNVTRQNKEPATNDRMKWLLANTPDKVDGNYEVVGELEYMPLRAAWASTVHKAQGLSLDNVQVDLRDGFYRTPGMSYVALTRCRTIEGLRIVGNAALLAARCNVDPRVRRWL